MSLLSKLLGGKKPTLSDVVDLLQGKDGQPDKPAQPEPVPAQNSWTAPAQNCQPEPAAEGPSGFSWGERMPDEPNQYNYHGSFREYFEDIFQRDFAEYQVSRQENSRSSGACAYTFTQGAETLLAVELLSRRNDVYKLRNDCRKQGIPYLRFYYDVDGWWNTRAYVIDRVSKALAR
ncbi:MAG: hypothetical protein J5789_02395 [Oscillospiraceae bacterium]|nr:hypothetical protein [Oscillospiraceae bacterium]